MWDLLRIAWRNVGRNKRRSVLSALAVGFAVAVLIFAMALQQGSYADMIYNVVHARTGNLQIQHPEFWPDQFLSKHLKDPGPLLDLADALPEVVGCAPRIQTGALVSSRERTFGAIVMGIDPAREAVVSTLADVVREGRFLEDADRDGVLVGDLLARNLDVAVGDELVFIGQGADGSLAAGRLWVRGLFRTGIAEIDRNSIAAHMETIGEAYSLYGGVTEIAVLLHRDEDRDAVMAELQTGLRALGRAEDAAVLPWTVLMPGVEQSMKLDWYSGQIVYAVLVCVVGFGIANTFLMAYMERIHEFGVLLALGMRPRRLGFLVYAESVCLILLGVGVGLALGIPFTQYWHRRGISFGEGAEEIMAEYGMSAAIHPIIRPVVLELAIAIVMGVALVLAVYPAWKASRLEPVVALRER